MSVHILLGQVVSFTESNVLHYPKGAIAIDAGGQIIFCGKAENLTPEFQSAPKEDYGDKLILPGFIDPHIHFPQYRMLAAPGKDLLDWLRRFTFPEESRFSDYSYAEQAAEIFINRLFAHGTTSALAFCSVHRESAEALFSVAQKYHMALITGKTMMDRNAIPAVQDEPEKAAREVAEIYQRWHGKGRLKHAVSPRFAITSSEEQLRLSGLLLQDLKGSLMQTHLSESHGEIEFLKQLFPRAKDYLDVYDHFGLLGEGSLFAHGIHLSERELQRLSETGSAVIHCPTSNNFLGSGLMSFAKMRKAEHPVALGIATDIGGGTNYSLLSTLGETYKVQMLCGVKPSAVELFRMATLGNAQRLHINQETGSLDIGKFANIVILDPCATAVLSARHELSESLEDMLFALMILGDDRAIAATYVAGQKTYQKTYARAGA